ncbi:hypothetical protein HNQ77_004833 [Silvibacterium bohemicum]|uniref:MobA/VirD2-like nuclease domain-containing protein n=1 Tax=Silvibacterium bohemicum TaxID=1577686 RepID=A0A841JZR5_9BACT|nr:hypothetical protein [Silvibacterium bohemicum]MBB6146852.1 hypothetical protein [Silvibacterium bohemicum]
MIAKGTTHNNGARLAAYMETSKDGERAELWQLRGFVATTIKAAFRDAQIMAGATKAQQPFFHVQVRNREGEKLSRQQWEYAADRIERMLGLAGQPRAIAFHTYEHNDDEHMHVAWSRIDQDKMTARPLPFFKRRLKTLSRELELEFVLEPVTSHREGPIKFAPTKAQDEQARRLGMDIHEVRNSIRNCWDRSDCGMSFQGALEHEGLTLAQGDRRDFVVIDRAGGVHALGKRILDMTAARIRERLSDLSRDELPTLEMLRDLIRETREEKQSLREKPAPIWDRDRDDRAWQDAVMDAAIEKEKVAKEFVEPVSEKTRSKAGSRKEDDKSVDPPQYQSLQGFEKAASEATRDDRTQNLRGPVARVWEAFTHSDSAKAYAAALDERGIMFAAVTTEEAYRIERERQFAKAIGNRAPRFKEGEIVIIVEPPLERRRNGQMIEPTRIHSIDQSLAYKLTKGLDNRDRLPGVDATLKASDERAQQRAAKWREIRFEHATNFKKPLSVTRVGRQASRAAGSVIKHAAPEAVATIGKAAGAIGSLGKALDVIGGMIESLAAPTLTPAQVYEGGKARDRREAEADQVIDFSRATAESAQQHMQDARDREAERERQSIGRER